MTIGLYDRITAAICTAIADGTQAYRMPWHNGAGIGLPLNAISGRHYRGINTLLLWAEATRAGYGSGRWATYRQWAAAGAQVRKGERATLVLLWKAVRGREDNGGEDDGAGQERRLARAFLVFNIDQVDGYVTRELEALLPGQRLRQADAFFAAIPATIRFDGERACYDPRLDEVAMPSFERFRTPQAFYSVLAHELTHWSGASSRLARDLTGRFGSDAYAMEELIAELGAAFIGGHLCIGCEPRTDHAPYIATWLRVLGNDARAIIIAASKAQAAADYLIAFSKTGAARHPEPDDAGRMAA